MTEVAVVTGAASGIGRGIAHRLAQDYTVILVDLNPTNLPIVETDTRHFHFSEMWENAPHISKLEN